MPSKLLKKCKGCFTGKSKKEILSVFLENANQNTKGMLGNFKKNTKQNAKEMLRF